MKIFINLNLEPMQIHNWTTKVASIGLLGYFLNITICLSIQYIQVRNKIAYSKEIKFQVNLLYKQHK